MKDGEEGEREGNKRKGRGKEQGDTSFSMNNIT